MYTTIPKKYITVDTNSTKTRGASFCKIPAKVQNPDPINPKKRFNGYTLKLVKPIPIRHSVVPNHFTDTTLRWDIPYMMLPFHLALRLLLFDTLHYNYTPSLVLLQVKSSS